MPNIKSAIRRVKTDARDRDYNKSVKSRVRTALKKVLETVDTDLPAAEAAYLSLTVNADKAAGKGVIHKNKAARIKSRLAKRINKARNPETK